ncbi:uncharacterized protein LOC142104243 isoform X1 [Mixophyes fleayi]|uniref:uncharacterized protein LOC142104243 isoform X1 n=1 Tax=Mixophyes fleayi TaxID=3061075 RepID=UPI003F4DFF90
MSRKPYLFLLLLHIYYEDVALSNLNVTQAPKELTLHKGDPATMTCHWTIGDDTQIRVEWTRYHMFMTGLENKTVLSSLIWTTENTHTPTERRNNTIYNITNNAAMMTMDSVTETDDGLYICEIIIEKPTLNKGTGNGTLLKIQEYVGGDGTTGIQNTLQPFNSLATTKKSLDQSNKSPPLAILGIIVIFPVAALAGYFLYKRRTTTNKKILQKKEQEAVELNQVNADNDIVEEDSTSSTHSVRWAVSIVYESVDYFAMKNPEDNAAACSTDNLAGNQTAEETCPSSM